MLVMVEHLASRLNLLPFFKIHQNLWLLQFFYCILAHFGAWAEVLMD